MWRNSDLPQLGGEIFHELLSIGRNDIFTSLHILQSHHLPSLKDSIIKREIMQLICLLSAHNRQGITQDFFLNTSCVAGLKQRHYKQIVSH